MELAGNAGDLTTLTQAQALAATRRAVALTLPDGRWAAVKVRLGGGQVLQAVASLNDAIAQIDTSLVGKPAFRLVVTGTGPSLVAEDGTVTAPLAALAP